MDGTHSLNDKKIIDPLRCIKLMDRNSFFIDALFVVNGIIQKELLNQKSAGNATIPFYLKIQQNSHKFVQLMGPYRLLRS
jgi:hypothetical protein